MGREIYDIINDMAEVLNASQMQKLQEVWKKFIHKNLEELWQPERLRRVCQLNKCRRYWDMSR